MVSLSCVQEQRDSEAMNKAVLVVDMLYDFVSPSGSLYVPGAEKLVPRIAAVLAEARRRGIPVIYACDAHAVDDPEFQSWPKHCVKNTPGAAIVPKLTPQKDDLVFEKQHLSVLSSEAFRAWLEKQYRAAFYIVGVATDYCVKAAATGLAEEVGKLDERLGLSVNAPRVDDVVVLADCVAGVDLKPGDTLLAAYEMMQAGAGFIRSDEAMVEFGR